METDIELRIQLEALITERDTWKARLESYKAMTAEGRLVEKRFFDEVEDNFVDIAHRIGLLLIDKTKESS